VRSGEGLSAGHMGYGQKMAPDLTSLEREIKLDTGPGFELPDLTTVGRRTVVQPGQELRTAYFDTDDFRLWDRGISLRHRRGEASGGQGTWTLKLPGARSGSILDRTELSWSGGRDAVPNEAVSVVQGLVRRRLLEPITELATTRRRFVFQNREGERCAELDDDTVTVVGGRGRGQSFRQLEVEIGPDGGAVADAVVADLRRAGAHLGGQPKLAMVLGHQFRSESAGSASGSFTVDARSSLGAVVTASLAHGLERILDHDYILRLHRSDPPPHAVHQARVATRRLRSDLKTVRSTLDPVWLDHTRAELQWLGGVLGSVRDADVLGGHLAEDLDSPPAGCADDADPDDDADHAGRHALRRRQEEQRRTAVRELSTVLTGARYLDLLDRLHAAAGLPPFIDPGPGGWRPEDAAARALPDLVGRQWHVLRKRKRKAGTHPSDRQLHRIRIAAKQLRYAAELATPVVGGAARRPAKAAERVQTVLGLHHDAVTAEQWLRDVARTSTPSTSYVAGRLSVHYSRRQRKLRRQWRSVWDELDQKKVLAWLR